VSIFILPPSMAILEYRLRTRQTDSEEVIARRLTEAREEIQHAFAFDYIVHNHDLQQAENELLAIFQATRLRQSNQVASIEKVLKSV
ncbi:guanylate kinase, partial [Kingella kingae]|nr:guanylate kinase [Kingella kingae]